MMVLRRIVLCAAAVAGGLLATAPGASASDAPACWNPEVYARPGMTHQYELYCPRTDDVELVSAPTDSLFEGLVQGVSVKFRLTPAATAPRHDTFTLRLTGPGGTTDQVIQVVNTPLDENTPPRCDPVSAAQRTSGTRPEPVGFTVICWDAEYDDYTLYGNGPGEHPKAPYHQTNGTGGQGVPSWTYIPTIASGQEQTSYYAVDALGARSADAPISIELGPTVDRLPTCGWASSAPSGASFTSIFARPGATRRFQVSCNDADGDAMSSQLAGSPSRGDLTRVDTAPASTGWWGTDQWTSMTYVPRRTYEGDDHFAMQATGPRGTGPVGDFAIVSRPPPFNTGGGCGWTGGASMAVDGAATLEAWCSDDEGDDMQAHVSSPPTHGTTGEIETTTGDDGRQSFSLHYEPDHGFTGTDSLTLAVSDANGTDFNLDFSLRVTDGSPQAPVIHTIGTPFDWPELHPAAAATWLPAVGQAPPVTPIDQARRALGRSAVRLLRRIGDASVYGPRTTPRAAASQKLLAVTCAVRCSLTSASTVVGHAAGSARRSIAPGRAVALTLSLSRAQRAGVRRAGHASARFKLAVARAGAKKRSATVRLALRAR